MKFKTLPLLLFIITLFFVSCFESNKEKSSNVEKRVDLISSIDTTIVSQKNNIYDSCNEKKQNNTIELGSLNDSIFLSFGNLAIGISADSVKNKLVIPISETTYQIGGVDGEYKKELLYVGFSVEVSSPDTSSITPRVISFWLKEGCQLLTVDSIGVGSTVDKLKHSLKNIISKSTPNRIFVGNTYYGTVFLISNMHVEKIFVGQLAE